MGQIVARQPLGVEASQALLPEGQSRMFPSPQAQDTSGWEVKRGAWPVLPPHRLARQIGPSSSCVFLCLESYFHLKGCF